VAMPWARTGYALFVVAFSFSAESESNMTGAERHVTSRCTKTSQPLAS
jgi:hypothetical protein